MGASDSGGSEAKRDVPSTGFLPLSLALALFITGLFVLGFVPTPTCDAGDSAMPSTSSP